MIKLFNDFFIFIIIHYNLYCVITQYYIILIFNTSSFVIISLFPYMTTNNIY